MCDPVSIALTVGSALLSKVASDKQVEAQYDAAERNAELSYQQIAEQREQINQQSQLEKSERIKQGMIERAQIATISGESGALGFSSDRLIGDSFMQESMDIASMETNRSNNVRQTEWEAKRVKAGNQSSVNQAEASGQSWLSTGLQIAGDGYNVYKNSKTKTTQKTGAA